MERKKLITIINGKEIGIIPSDGTKNLLEEMRSHKVMVSSPCGGHGTCGKCKIKIIKGAIEDSIQDRIYFSSMERDSGIRLACQAYPKEDCTIRIITNTEENILAVANYREDLTEKQEQKEQEQKEQEQKEQEQEQKEQEQKEQKQQEQQEQKEQATNRNHTYGIAIDLGTTTLVFQLLDLNDHKIIGSFSSLNRQRAYGADVISRMTASIEGKGKELQETIRQDLYQGMNTLMTESGIPWNALSKITIAGNTTMIHLLLGESCEDLGVYPFQSVNLTWVTRKMSDLFPVNLETPIHIYPGISAFVGGDIVSGIYASNMDEEKNPCLLVDLGTNGEMAIGNEDRILVTSTAAGPAFEGGNLSCGVGSVPGAIHHIIIKEDELHYETIGGKAPIGICGTGIIELIAELLDYGFIDESGLFHDLFLQSGFPIGPLTILQKDIREFQLAKAAIRAGIERLVLNYGITYEEINKVYLAGGFGFWLNVSKAIRVGLFPKELEGKIVAVGNSSLGGVSRGLWDNEVILRMKQITEKTKEIHLSNDPEFYHRYIASMTFI